MMQDIPVHDDAGFEGMRQVGGIAAECLDALCGIVRPGITTADIDAFVYAFGMDRNAIPATLGYKGYRHSCCTSVNEVICHGIPSDEQVLNDGDIVNVDVTFILDGWHGDSSRMYPIGGVSADAGKLMDITHESLMLGIGAVKPGNTVGDIGHAIQQHAESAGYSVVREFCGHGIGRRFHSPPHVMHFGLPGQGEALRPGMVFTIEPMINRGLADSVAMNDGWSAVTKDGKLSAQYEHTVGVTDSGCEIFTLSRNGTGRPGRTD